MQDPLVTVIVTCFNKEKYIERCIDSIIAQQCNFPLKILVIDDCSTDNSVEIINKFCLQKPELFKFVKNDTNQGISLTWRKACSLAEGKYIARMDGDDYWTDELKLQKQINALENCEESCWSTTDFDIFYVSENKFEKNALENNILPKIDNYEQMLALKGMTMASTWVCETNTMLKANKLADPNLMDDTFAIQLELFKLTSRLYLSDSTTIYTVYEQSDSNITKERTKKLLEVQKAYIAKYPDTNFSQALYYACEEIERNEEYRLDQAKYLNALEEELMKYSKAYEFTDEQLKSILNSKSWKITKPLRYLTNLFQQKANN